MNEITKELLDALATLAAPQSDDGWIPWAGGECPVDPGTCLDVEYRDGEKVYNVPAGDCDWANMESDYDIIAYRVVKP